MATITINTIAGVEIITGEDGQTVAEILEANKGTQSFANAQLAGTDLSGADLTDIDLAGADLFKATIDEDTVLTGAILTGACLQDMTRPAVVMDATVANGLQAVVISNNVSQYDGSLEGHVCTVHVGQELYFNNGLVKQYVASLETQSGDFKVLTLTPIISGNRLKLSGVAGVEIVISLDLLEQYFMPSVWPVNNAYRVNNYLQIDCIINNYIG